MRALMARERAAAPPLRPEARDRRPRRGSRVYRAVGAACGTRPDPTCRRRRRPSALIARLGQIGSYPKATACAEILALFSTVLQVMKRSLLADPFKDEGWTEAFRESPRAAHRCPSFSRLAADIAEMQGEVSAAAGKWYAKAKGL